MSRKRYGIETTHGDDFERMCTELLARVEEAESVVRLVFFGAPSDNGQYFRQLETIKAAVARRFGEKCPVVTYVAQKPLRGQLKMEITTLDTTTGGVGSGGGKRDGEAKIKYGNKNYLVISDRTGDELVIGGVFADDPALDVSVASEQIFGKIGRIMASEGFAVNSIVRQWNYIEGITEMSGGRQHYQDFNDARSRFYARTEWPYGYPAATGIGTQLGGVMVELNARRKSEGIIDIALDNSLQVAAHSYSQQVLVGEGDGPSKCRTTPKFERARLMGYPDDATVYVSGTAAIRGEGSCAVEDVAGQTRTTMENIEFLCSPENINSRGEIVTGKRRKFGLLRVYVKNPDHLGQVREYMDGHYANVPKFYLYADVCRPELLVEIEGVAYIK